MPGDKPAMAGGEAAAATQKPEDSTAEHSQAAENPAADETLTAEALAIWDAIRVLARAVHGFALALAGLARSEWRLARASWPLVVALAIVLVGIGLSLWASLVALIGWGFFVATASVGWALTALVGVHLVLLLVVRLALRRSSRNLTMPETRRELHGLVARARGKRPEPEA
ncbi:MAG: hypothetical protein WCD36_14195 [Rhodanobacteraceae bacterium]